MLSYHNNLFALSICTNHKPSFQALAENPAEPFHLPERADITRFRCNSRRRWDHARGRACSAPMLPRHGHFLSN
jgi:hypothetical protein